MSDTNNNPLQNFINDIKQTSVERFKINNPEYMKKYYIENKEKYNEKITCAICNGVYKYSNKSKHEATKKHIRALTT